MAAGLGLLLFLPVPLLRSMGVGGLLIPLASIAAALTPQPALLGLLGRRAFRPRRGRVGHGLWARLARSIMRRPLVYLLAGGALLLAAAAPLARLEPTSSSFSALRRRRRRCGATRSSATGSGRGR